MRVNPHPLPPRARCCRTTAARSNPTNGLLFAARHPIVYYGDEIGMGDNVYLGDRDAVRTPMQWSADRNGGLRASNPATTLPAADHRSAAPLRGRERGGAAAPNPGISRWMRRLIAPAAATASSSHDRYRHRLRQQQGAVVPADVSHHRRGCDRDEDVLVAANLLPRAGRHAAAVPATPRGASARAVRRTELDPVEGDRYRLTLGPHRLLLAALAVRRLEGVSA
ncbi:MAG: hypothetical protein R2713_07120 [Ilumatobacteraceae bacterium]